MEETLNKLLEELDKTIFYIEFKKEYLKEKGIRDKRIKKDLKKLKKSTKNLNLYRLEKLFVVLLILALELMMTLI